MHTSTGIIRRGSAVYAQEDRACGHGPQRRVRQTINRLGGDMLTKFWTGLLTALGAVALLATSPSFAQEIPDKPFAEAKFVLQISDMDPDKQTLVLNVAGNIIKYYGPDKTDVEIVAFGPGLRLLFEGNSNTGRVASLADSGVRFAACQNTITNMSGTLGRAVVVNPRATVVPGGVVRIKQLVDAGYTLIKP